LSDVHLKYINRVHVKVEAEPSTLMELSDQLTFYAENYKFHPKYRARMWDGKIRLLNNLTCYVYAGLARFIKKFCEARGYSFSFDDELYYENISEHELREFIDTLGIPEKYAVRDYQFDSILKCIRSGRRTLVSPTSSGKSLMIYILMRWYQEHKGLIIVPTIGLVGQMESDFRDYGYKGRIHLSTQGLSRTDNDIECDILISTWQSLNNGKHKMPKAWYEQFGIVFGDEAHHAKATSIIQILSSMVNCKYRFGTTGTLDGTPLNEYTIEGLFGPKYSAVTTKDLMDSGYVSKLKIKCIVLKYPEQTCKDLRGKSYNEEIDFLVNNQARTKFIRNLGLSLKGNKLIFFRIIDHGKLIADSLSNAGASNLFYIDGSVTGDERETIRKAIEDEENAILVASLGTTSTGVNIKKLHHMIAASPSKSKIKVLQSIGRMLRQHESKDQAVLYDIVDDLSYKSRQNFTLKHFLERSKIYDAEKFDYEIYNVKV
jgi:superfamily II DNA or RNA helicase